MAWRLASSQPGPTAVGAHALKSPASTRSATRPRFMPRSFGEGPGRGYRLVVRHASAIVWAACRGPGALAPLGVVRGSRRQVERHDRLVTHDPGIVPRLDHPHVASDVLLLAAVVASHVDASGRHDALVEHLAAVAADDRLHVLRPAPARLEGAACG